MNQKRSEQFCQAMYFDVHKKFLFPDHVARQACRCRKNHVNSHYDGKRKGWDWANYIFFHKERHSKIESLTEYGYSGIHNGTEVHHFLLGSNSTEVEAAVDVVWAQQEKYTFQVKPKVMIFMEKIECMKHSKVVLIFHEIREIDTGEKTVEQQGNKFAIKLAST